ncbi:DUF3048 domain-containing protein [Haloechinothrix sp. YIM 98757]|uniref:DUF3048 domain-containing protein n=1 Tax=Haloechinothrix aidingensis TaxID=2752311 RepID=A0A837ZZ00_9PSEU|nr:DUF3048 domain-containing protein [Haloechinothrix aidingensis]
MLRKPLETLIALLAAAGVVGVVALGVWLVRDGVQQQAAEREAPPATAEHPPPPEPEPEPEPERAPAPELFPPALVTKIDAGSSAVRYRGLASAGAMYVEPVEGGLTRMLAVHWGQRPDALGPVRSARETDIELLGQFEEPVLAYSGSASQLRPSLYGAGFRLATPGNAPGGFYRDSSRPSPHNLYARPNRLPGTPAVDEPFATGPAPDGGEPTGSYRVSYRSASYEFAWSGDRQRWLVARGGNPITTAESGRLDAGTVVVLRVPIAEGLGITDSTGALSPVARTVGSGEALVLRDGRRFDAEWSRAARDEGMELTTAGGEEIPYAEDGKLWVLLVPR